MTETMQVLVQRLVLGAWWSGNIGEQLYSPVVWHCFGGWLLLNSQHQLRETAPIEVHCHL